ncbi:MAG: RecX family transcriptional regulator [Bacilli bacterium]|nr:RecX family transcriptional regulator [Bacilli bacterium]
MQLENLGNIKIKYKIKSDYVVFDIDGDKYKVSVDFFNSLNIDENIIASDYLIEQIKSEAMVQKIVNYCRKLAVKKPYSESQLIKKINKKFDNPKELKRAFSALRNSNIFDDENYIQNYKEYFDNNLYGKYYIINYFRNQNVKQRVIDSLEFDEQFEMEKAKKFFEQLKNKYIRNNYAKQKKKIYDLMLFRGYSVEIILDVLNSLEIDETKEKKKLINSYLKIKNKLNRSSKYGVVDINSKIVNKLIAQGYNYSLISEVIAMDKRGELDD